MWNSITIQIFIPNFFITFPRFFENILSVFQKCFQSFLKFIKITLILISSIFFLHFLITWIISQNFLKMISQVSKVLKINYKFLQMFQILISLLAICSSNFLKLIRLFSGNYFKFFKDFLPIFLSVLSTFSEFLWNNYYIIFVTRPIQ